MENEEKFMARIKQKIESKIMNNLTSFIKKDELLYKFVLEKTEFLKQLSYKPTMSQRVWHIHNNCIEIPICQECGEEVAFADSNKGYHGTCSIYCSAKFSIIKVKATKALNHDGDPNWNNTEKNKTTRALNHPEDPTFNNRPLALITVRKKHGVDNVSQVEEFKKKKIETCLINNKTEYPMQNAEIAERSFKNAKQLKEYTMPSGKIVMIQGWEDITLDALLIVFNEEDIFVGNVAIENEIGKIRYKLDDAKKGDGCIYRPDAYVKSINKVFETKSDWTYKGYLEKNIYKERATLKAGLNFEFVIYDKKKILISEGTIIGDFDKNSI